jgi:hypothetical protein
MNSNGSLDVFGLRDDHVAVRGSGPDFGSWPVLAGSLPLQTTPAVVLNPDGREEAFAVGLSDGLLYHSWEPSWPGWQSLGNPGRRLLGQPSTVRWNDGHVEVFVRDVNGTPWHIWRGSGGWSGWVSLGGTFVQDPKVMLNQDGHAELFGVGTDGAVWHTWFSWSGGWMPYGSLGGVSTSKQAMVLNTSGSLEIFVIGTTGQLYHQWQVTPNGGWSGWGLTGPAPAGRWSGNPAVSTTPTGSAEAFAADYGGSVYHASQPGWSPWLGLPGQSVSAATSPSAVQEGSTGISVWYIGSDGQMWSASRDNAGSWSGPVPRGGR